MAETLQDLSLGEYSSITRLLLRDQALLQAVACIRLVRQRVRTVAIFLPVLYSRRRLTCQQGDECDQRRPCVAERVVKSVPVIAVFSVVVRDDIETSELPVVRDRRSKRVFRCFLGP